MTDNEESGNKKMSKTIGSTSPIGLFYNISKNSVLGALLAILPLGAAIYFVSTTFATNNDVKDRECRLIERISHLENRLAVLDAEKKVSKIATELPVIANEPKNSVLIDEKQSELKEARKRLYKLKNRVEKDRELRSKLEFLKSSHCEKG